MKGLSYQSTNRLFFFIPTKDSCFNLSTISMSSSQWRPKWNNFGRDQLSCSRAQVSVKVSGSQGKQAKVQLSWSFSIILPPDNYSSSASYHNPELARWCLYQLKAWETSLDWIFFVCTACSPYDPTPPYLLHLALGGINTHPSANKIQGLKSLRKLETSA